MGTDPGITHPANVMFLVDKDVYQNTDYVTGSILEATRRFVETVANATTYNDERKTTY